MNTIIVRFIDSNKGEQITDLEISDTVFHLGNIKKTIREKIDFASNKRLKLIYNGRVINDKFKFTDLKFTDHKCYIHCVIGETLTIKQLNEENELDNEEIKQTTQPQVIGFDRLLQQGFSQQDIDQLRSQFENIHNIDRSSDQPINDLEEEEQRQNYIRQLEERWIESTVNPSGGTTTRATAEDEQNGETVTHNVPSAELEENHNKDLLIGLMIGVFLGIVAGLFVICDDSIFNKRQKMAITAGIFVNFSMAIVRGQWI
ncbi:DSC E3 ubiquitin ligase complex subunit 3 [[Candida] jaroonii]|uniref:DSC E3 ubiquitin ligase complex subunit 3 n=1 Tax=[Candida] jaroonii TaxID=467808 RepID=A0ACA9Y006_9ASCO|nr:DSC E3 ubiquitin ligase complex subunit 3 [[Candida] jaroonii]